jgi:hypothetical protein
MLRSDAARSAAAKELPAMFAWMTDLEPVRPPLEDALRWALTPLGRAELDDVPTTELDESECPVDESH